MNNAKVKLLAALVSSSLFLAGCSGSSSSLEDTIDLGNLDIVNPYAGSSIISGVVALSSLSGADAGALDGSSAARLQQMLAASSRTTYAAATQNAIIKLYVVGPDGELLDTGINCSFTDQADDKGNPKYSCPDVADGKQYVIKYLRLLEGNKALEMKVNIEVPEGAPVVEGGEVSPESTVVVDTIINAILSATEGKDIEPAIVDDIIKAVKQAVVVLVQSGAVQVPSMVVDAPKDATGAYITDVAVLESDADVAYGENKQLESTAGTLLSDESVADEVDAVKVEIEVREFERIDSSSEAGKRKLVDRVFKEMLDGDVPEFIGDFFATRFVENRMIDLGALFDSVAAGLEIDPRLGIDLAGLQVTKSGAMTAFEQKLGQIYTLMARKAEGTMTDEDRKAFREIPSVIPALFPAQEWQGKTFTLEEKLNVPQAVAFVIFVTDVYVADALEQHVSEDVMDSLVSVEEGEGGAVEIEMDDPVEFNPMHFDPVFAENGTGGQPGLMQLYGFFEQDNLATLNGVDVSWLDIMPDKAWIPGPDGTGGREVDMLRANVCVSDLSMLAQIAQMTAPQNVDGVSDLTVDLTYPTSTGTATVALLSEAGLYMPAPVDGTYPDQPQEPEGEGANFESCFVLDPWASAQMANGSDNGYVDLTENDIISDFVSGVYRVDVKRAGAVIASKEFEQKVLVGMSDVRPRLTSPNGMPEWPKACEGKAFCAEWDALQQQWLDDGGVTTFALNMDSNGDGDVDKAKVTLSWEKPEVELPDGVKIAYSLNVGLNGGCDETGNCSWQPVYDTWQQDRKLFGTSFTLPVLLDKVQLGQGSYNVNVCALFIDTDTGREIGRGSCNWAEFQVGDPLNLDATFTIVGAVPAGFEAGWKAALMKESFNADALGEQWQREVVQLADIVNGGYTLTPTIRDYLGADPGAHYQIVLFKDDDGDGQIGSPEPIVWPDWENNVRFETWGGVLRHVKEEQNDDGEFKRRERVITGGEQVDGPDFTYLEEPGLVETPGTEPPVS